MKKMIFGLLLILNGTAIGTAQNNYHLSDTIVYLVKPMSFENVHWYVEIFNDSTLQFPMMWKAHFGKSFPEEWTVNFDDGTQNHPEVFDQDSSEFQLLFEPFSPQKLIIGVKHNGTPGQSTVKFNLYPLKNPADSIHLTYDVTFTEISGTIETAYSDFKQINNRFVFPDPVDQVSVFSLNGKKVFEAKQVAQINLTESQSGIYILFWTNGRFSYSKKVFLE